jgi:putative membrane protein
MAWETQVLIKFLLHAAVAAVGFWLAARFVPGVHAGGWQSLLAAGLLLGVLNAVVRPILVFFTLPLTLLTLGLFLFVVNGLTVWMVSALLHGVKVDGFIPAMLAAIVISLVSWLAGGLINQLTSRNAA